jgi:glycosyltransferase involved in cell wall biosynthesis
MFHERRKSFNFLNTRSNISVEEEERRFWLSCGALVVARDEEKRLEESLKSLRRQTMSVFLVVVDDGSRDATSRIASKYADAVVRLPGHRESWVGLPQLATVFNAGFNVLRTKKVEHVLISGADSVYPGNYVEEIIGRMKREGVVLGSGIAEGEVSRSLSPRGSGRVIEGKWFESISFCYPKNYGFEVYLVFKALSEGRKVVVYSDLKFKLSRGTGISANKSLLWGKGMRVLNYWWLYALGRCVLAGIRNPLSGAAMLKGYVFDGSKRYGDLGSFVPKFQKRLFVKRLREIL